MDPTKEELHSVPLDVPEFYDLLAPGYDAMTGIEKRFVQERPYFRLLVERYGIETALDAGCGSGFHSLLLSELGVRVTGIDASKEMLKRARANARARGVTVRWLEASFASFTELMKEKVDSVFVLGNSLPHLLSADDLRIAVSNFSAALKPEGVLIIQILNYDRLLATRDQIQNTKTIGNRTFVRFYEYEGNDILFHIQTRTTLAAGVDEELRTVRLRPILKDDLVELLAHCGFADVSVFGTISMEPFDRDKSKDLVLLAHKL